MKFVTFELAVKLKEKGFKTENTDWCYLDGNLVRVKKHVNISPYEYAPTISQVLDWLRNDKRIDAGAVWDNRDRKWVGYVNEMDMPDLIGEYILPNTYDSYELAVIAIFEYIIDNNLI